MYMNICKYIKFCDTFSNIFSFFKEENVESIIFSKFASVYFIKYNT